VKHPALVYTRWKKPCGRSVCGQYDVVRLPELFAGDSRTQRRVFLALSQTQLLAEDIFFLDSLALGIRVSPGAVCEVFRMGQLVKQVLDGGKFDVLLLRIEYPVAAVFRDARIEQNFDIFTAPVGKIAGC
jgi:hypothetical protein